MVRRFDQAVVVLNNSLHHFRYNSKGLYMLYFLKTPILSCLATIFFLMPYASYAYEKRVSLDLQNVSIQDVLHILARSLNKNIIISPSIHGSASLHLNDMSDEEAFDMVLATYDLRQWKIKNAWFISSKEEFIQRKEADEKLKAIEYETSPIMTRVWQIRYAKAVDIVHLLEDGKNTLVTKRGYVSVDARTNRVCVRDIEMSMKGINELINQVDIPVRQVLIEAHLASIDSDYERELGIHFAVNQPQMADGVPPVASLLNPRYSLAVIHLPDGSNLNMQLAALERAGHGELISSPSLFTASQQTAVIESGEEIPYQESSSSGATSVTFKKAVLSLKVTPQIMPDNQVLLQLQVNQDKPSKRMVLGVPAINTRQITTNVQVKAGQTIVLGGIYEVNKEQQEQRIPFLADIPLIGWLFRQQNSLKNKRELLIFVTPRIIN